MEPQTVETIATQTHDVVASEVVMPPPTPPNPESSYNQALGAFREARRKQNAGRSQTYSSDVILEVHQKWAHEIGKPKQKRSADLSGKALKRIDLRGAILNDANFTNCDLTAADFTEAELKGANFTGAELCNAKFHNANLEEATFTDAKNLNAQQIGGANLHNIVPADAVKIDGTAYVDESLKSASKLHLLLNAICVFSVLTIGRPNVDAEIILASGTAKLPLVDLPLSMPSFFLIAPLIVLLTHVTLHIQLMRAWEAMALDLPAVFPDGTEVERKIFPFLLNPIALRQWKQLKNRRLPFHTWQVILTSVTLYWTAPVTLFFFWERSLIKQNFPAVMRPLLLLALSLWAERSLRYIHAARVQRVEWQKLLLTRKAIFSHVLVVLLPPAVLCCLSLTALHYTKTKIDAGETQDGKTKTEYAIARFMRDHVSADLTTGLSMPSDWFPRPDREALPSDTNAQAAWQKYDEQIKRYRGVQLPNTSLRFARLYSCFLVNANLYQANLSGAELRGTDLSNADLTQANLSGANMTLTYLNKAILIDANLSGANLTAARLVGIYTSDKTDFTGANLLHADLRKADLSEAKGLDKAKMKAAKYNKNGFDGTQWLDGTKWPDGFDPKAHGAVEVDEYGRRLKKDITKPLEKAALPPVSPDR